MEEPFHSDNNYRVKYVQFDTNNANSNNANSADSDTERVGDTIVLHETKNSKRDFGPENDCKASRSSCNMEKETEMTTIQMSNKKFIKLNTKCKLSVSLIIVAAVVIALFIALFTTIIVFGIKIQELQSEQETTEGKVKSDRKLFLQLVGNQSESFDNVITKSNDEERINMAHNVEDIGQQMKNLSDQVLDLRADVLKNMTTITTNIHHIVDEAAYLEHEKDILSRKVNEWIEKLTANQDKDIKGNLTSTGNQIPAMASDILKNITNIASKMKQIADDVSSLRNNTDNRSKTLNELIQQLKEEVRLNMTHYAKEQLQDDVKEIRTQVADIENNVNMLMNETVSTASDHIVFRALKIKSGNVTSSIIKFEDVGLNKRNGYNSSTGIFTAPADGIYIFSWTIVTTERVSVATELVVNNQLIAKAFADARDSTKWMDDSSTNLIPVSMKQGEEAFIRINNRWGRFVDGDKWSSFSGWKLN